MSSSIEDEIVAMKFDNRQFESGVNTSLGTIGRLKESLQFKDAGAGLSNVQRGLANFSLGHMQGALTSVSKGWVAMSTVAITALANITNRVVNAGINLAKSFTVQPILDGFHEYETNLNSVQTIMSNTGKNVKTVNKYLNELNHYSDKTIYNFSEMAKNIGTFTAAGVDLKTSTASIKGIANLAALSGSNADQASNAMYQLSQAIASGKVGLQDWNSVVNAGMGGKVFQKALADTGVAMGTLNKGAVKLVGPMKQLKINGEAFRNTIAAKTSDGSEPWLTSEVLTKTLTQFTGDLKQGQIVAMGFSKAQAKAIMATAHTAQQAATRVKTFTQLIDVVKESIGSGWAMIFQNLFGNFRQASKLWTGVSTTITGAIAKVFKSISVVLKSWQKLGGYTDLWTGIGNIFKIIGNILGPFVAAFKTLFPAGKEAGAGLAHATHGFAAFTGWIEKGTRSFKVITPVLVFFFGAIKKGVGFIFDMIGALKPFIGLLASFGHYAAGLVQDGASIAQGLIGGLLQGLNLGGLKEAIYQFAENIIVWIKDRLGIHSPSTEMIPVGYNIVTGIAKGIAEGTIALIRALGEMFSKFWDHVVKFFSGMNITDVLAIINTAFMGGVFLAFTRFFGALTGLFNQGGNLLGSISKTFNALTGTLQTMQNKVRSEIIRNIAISIGILAAAAFVLARVDAKKLGISLGAIATMMITLMAAMKSMVGWNNGMNAKEVAKNTANIVAISGAMVLFASAILVMTAAVALMGQLDTKTIAKGLAGVAGVVGIIVASTKILSGTGGGATIVAAAAAMVIMAAGLTAMAGVLKLYSMMDWRTILVGGGEAAGVIAVLGLALKTFGSGSFAGSAALVVASGALVVLAGALKLLAGIPLMKTIKALAALGIAMVILAAGATALTFAEGGAASMLIISAAVVVLATGLKMLSKIPFGEAIKGLLILALAFVVIGGAAIALTPVIPVIAALGSALLTLSAAIALGGVGMLAFATGLGVLAAVGVAGFAALTAGIMLFLESLPLMVQQFGLTLIAIVDVIGKVGPRVISTLGQLLRDFLDEIIKTIPKIGETARALIDEFLKTLRIEIPNIVLTGVDIVLAVIEGITKRIYKIVDAAVKLIVNFSNAITSKGNMDKIVKAAFDVLGKFLEAIGNYIHDHWNDWVEKGREIGEAIKQGLQEAAATAVFNLPGTDTLFNWAGHVASILPGGKDDPKAPKPQPKPDANPFPTGGGHQPAQDRTMSDLGRKAADSLRSGFDKEVATTPPTVSPVLDLSQLQKDATKIEGTLPAPQLKTDTSRQHARDVASVQQPKHAKAERPVVINYKQEIKSKDPIDHVKVYRGTKSGLALVKEEVKNQK